MRLSALFLILMSALIADANARPVSYVDGWTAIQETDRQTTTLWAHYTVHPKLSLGWRSEWDRQNDVAFHGPQATVLLKRWFGQNYQGNVYGFAGGGFAEGVGSNAASAKLSGHAGVMADWETRRLFVSYRARVVEANELGGSAMHAARIGVAPYVGDTGDLHTWFMVEIDQRPENQNPVDVTPLVRFFKGAALFELGWSVGDDEPLLNFTYRF